MASENEETMPSESSNDEAALKVEQADSQHVEDATASTSAQDDESDNVVDDNAMPLLKYSRINGVLPRVPQQPPDMPSNPLSTPATCAQLGRIKLSRDDTDPRRRSSGSTTSPQPVVLTGYQNGSVSFVHVESGAAVVESKQLLVDESTGQHAIIDVSLDASANYLAAINAAGTCVIWEVKYSADGDAQSALDTTPPEENMFTSFLTTLAGQPITPSPSMADDAPSQRQRSGRFIKSSSVVVSSRVTYNFGCPSCLCLDPSYKRRREKAILVAFQDGRLVLSKKGMFGRRNDAILYQAGAAGGSIEAVEWRGALVAWADGSGIKLFDVESMTRIAHVDRPAGARASLYPTIRDLKPSLYFETSDNLIVAWGDCVMTMHIKETIVRQQAPSSPDTAAATTAAAELATVVKRRQVECSMAWELDCVACGVAPLDKDHLIVLGLVPNDDDDDDDDDSGPSNDVEVQIISRAAGTVTYADALPIMRFPSQFSAQGGLLTESASAYRLLSVFSVPRMEDNVEADEEGTAAEADFDFTLFSSNSNNKASFVDSHLRWSLETLLFDGGDGHDGDDKADDDSDYYGFLIQESSDNGEGSTALSGAAPVMVVQGPADLVTISTRDVDDAISHALSMNKVGLALHRALRHKRKVRKHDLNELIDSFLRTVLSKLSLRRLELAARSTPVLLGGSAQRWEQWVREFARIPGALFVLCDQLPVRDPKLPSHVYTEILSKLFREIEEMLNTDTPANTTPDDVVQQAIDRFLGSLCAWGPTHALREKVRFQEYNVEQRKRVVRNGVSSEAVEGTRKMLDRRLTQAATGYLELPTSSSSKTNTNTDNTSAPIVDSSSDSLFSLNEFMMTISARVPIFREGRKDNKHSEISPSLLNTKVALEALAELSVMGTKYEMALRYYLAIGNLFSTETLQELEKQAVDGVNHIDNEEPTLVSNHNSYGFVLSMVEHHHLHGSLLDSDLLPDRTGGKKLSPPLVSLVRLLGLDLVGDFLVAHCVPPPGRANYHSSGGSTASNSVNTADSESSRATKDGDETLPINYVAEQLQSSPALLHWYLHLIFTRKPEMYVHFPTTAVPPRAVTELHRIHLDLYIDFAEDRDSAQSLAGTEVYNHERKTTPLITFLKAALPLGGIQPDEVRRLLEAKRSESTEDVTEFPHSFALELAYVIDNYGDGSEEESQQVLDLYLKGAKSVMLAAAYAQRNTEHTSALWEALIEYCLEGGDDMGGLADEQRIDGTLFGSLMEAAALVGADLAVLVTSIPQRMNIEGLRPRLVAAVADYRMKLTLHEAAAETCRQDRISLLRELGHRSRRGMRQTNSSALLAASRTVSSPGRPKTPDEQQGEKTIRRPMERPSRYRLSVQLPMR